MIIYVDGSCNCNPGPGGFGVIILDNDENLIDIYSERFKQTTNNRMEMSAILWAMDKYGNSYDPPILYSDSAYAINCFDKWIWGWKNNGWIKSSDKKPPENLDLLLKYIELIEQDKIVIFKKVKGHSTNKWNNLADALATNKIREYLKIQP